MNKTIKIASLIATVLGLSILGTTSIKISPPLTYRTSTLSLIGHSYDNMIIENIVIHDTGGDGIFLRGVDNVTIRNCEIYGVSEGIVLSSLGSTKNVTIENCNIHDTGRNGIIVKQQELQKSNQVGVIIRNNTITNTGKSSTSGAYHAIYMQATDSVISGNTIDTSTGNGVSIRSSGKISENKIYNTQKSCIRYFSDNVVGVSKKLLIENNLCVNPNQSYPGISLLWGLNPKVVETYDIRFNTIIGGLNGIHVQSSQFSTYAVNAYGNLYTKQMVNTYIDYSYGNILSTANSLNLDYSIPIGHPAISNSNGVRDYPERDILGFVRNTIDSGAFAYISGAVVPTSSQTKTSTPTATHTLIFTKTPTLTITPTPTKINTLTPTISKTCFPVYVGDSYVGAFCP